MNATANRSELLLDLVRKSELISNDELDAFVGRLRVTDKWPDQPKPLAVLFVKEGLLTTYQAKQLLQGRYRGFVLNSKYRLMELLATGGMGAVYLCEHVFMRRLVALKVLTRNLVGSQKAVDRFLREARAVASLDHPNIVRAFDLDKNGDYFCLVMEFVDGRSLQEIVEQRGQMAHARAAHYIAQAAMGLQHAFEGGWVHRDIKPANILLSRQGVVKILDMGLARLFDDANDKLTQQHDGSSILGTADYVSPEQINTSDVDIRTDVYSLGATFYFMLSGKAPFADLGLPQKFLAHQTKEPTPIRTLRPDVPEGLAAVLQKMMAKSPADRYQTPAAIAAALSPWTQQPIAAPPREEMPMLTPALLRHINEERKSTPPNGLAVPPSSSVPAVPYSEVTIAANLGGEPTLYSTS
ncbi:MAG: serine/threonine protein kinase, partial [Planctomycetia bacterium]